MQKVSILLPNIETVRRFVNFANRYKFPVTIISGKYRINAKSIMGIFGLDLSKSLQIEVRDDYPEDFKEKLKEFAPVAKAV